jgi:phosphoribosylformylglycinamidine synthase
LLFGESQSRVIVSVPASRVDRVLQIAHEMSVPAERIGAVGGERLVIDVPGEPAGCRIDATVAALYDEWAYALERALKTP